MEKQLKTRIQHKIDTYENWEKAINFTPLKGEIIIYTTDENGYDKVGLKIGNGQDNVKDLPFVETAAAGGAGGGAATPQIQSDWLQENHSKKDYIKNKPFYSLPPEHNFDLGLNRAFEEYIWDGDTTNRKKVSLNYEGIEVEWYKVSDNFYTRDQVLNGYAYVNPYDTDTLNMMMGNEALSCLVPIPLSDSVLTNIILYSDEHYLIGLGAVSTDVPGILPLPDGNGGTIEIDIPEPGTYYLYDKTGAMFGVPGSYTKQIVGAVDVLGAYKNTQLVKEINNPKKSLNVFQYSVNNISSPYGFYLNNNNYYESNNKGKAYTYAVCRVTFTASKATTVYVDCINYAESSFDFGLLSKINT